MRPLIAKTWDDPKLSQHCPGLGARAPGYLLTMAEHIEGAPEVGAALRRWRRLVITRARLIEMAMSMHWPGHVAMGWQRDAIQIMGRCGQRSWWIDFGTRVSPVDTCPEIIRLYVSKHDDDVSCLATLPGTPKGLEHAGRRLWRRWHSRWA